MKMKRLLAFVLATVVSSSVSHASVKMIENDVLVVGGGPSGVPAAIQAASADCSTVLVEAGRYPFRGIESPAERKRGHHPMTPDKHFRNDRKS